MATHCTIAIINDDNTISMTEAHSDGYVFEPGVGSKLVKYYTDYNIVKELISYGDVAYLGKKLHPTGTEHSIDWPEDDVCCFFLSDSDEYEEDDEDFTTAHFSTIQEYEERIKGWGYNYLFEDGEWYIIKEDKKMLVKDHPDYDDGTSEPTAHSTVQNPFNNEKLLELAKQAAEIHDKYYLQVFAELIVKECCRVMAEHDQFYGEVMMSPVLKEHFGVE